MLLIIGISNYYSWREGTVTWFFTFWEHRFLWTFLVFFVFILCFFYVTRKLILTPFNLRGRGAANQLVNIVLNRRREEDSSLDSDDTIELHLSGNRWAHLLEKLTDNQWSGFGSAQSRHFLPTRIRIRNDLTSRIRIPNDLTGSGSEIIIEY